jgi:hypothetical protein
MEKKIEGGEEITLSVVLRKGEKLFHARLEDYGPDPERKDKVISMIRNAVRDQKLDTVLLVFEAWSLHVSKDADEKELRNMDLETNPEHEDSIIVFLASKEETCLLLGKVMEIEGQRWIADWITSENDDGGGRIYQVFGS